VRFRQVATLTIDPRAASSQSGDPRNPALLFLHGIRLGREIWVAHARALAAQYHVVTLDLPGHGALAGVPFTEANLDALLDDVIATIAGSPPLIVGYSLGGFVAMRYAARFPERTRALLLAGCTLDFEAWKWWPYGLSVRLTQLLPDTWTQALMHLSLYLSLPRHWLDVVEAIPFDRDVFRQTSAIVRSKRRALDELASYAKPVLIVNGEYDFVFRLDERRSLHRLPQARLRIIRGTAHTAPLYRAEAFTSIVEDFARQVFAPAQPRA
jgi:pimeloyl-ACP methyl ester carboxylesterase